MNVQLDFKQNVDGTTENTTICQCNDVCRYVACVRLSLVFGDDTIVSLPNITKGQVRSIIITASYYDGESVHQLRISDLLSAPFYMKAPFLCTSGSSSTLETALVALNAKHGHLTVGNTLRIEVLYTAKP